MCLENISKDTIENSIRERRSQSIMSNSARIAKD